MSAEDNYEKILIGNLQRAIDFLKFAEAKNAALLALASAWVVAVVNLICNEKKIPDCLSASLSWTLVLSLGAGLIAMISFLPRLHLPKFLGGKYAGPHPKNLLYYGDISSLPTKTLENDLYTRYFPSAKKHKDEYIHDLIVQISVNSQIAMRKMYLFRCGMALILIAGLILLIPAIGMALKNLGIVW